MLRSAAAANVGITSPYTSASSSERSDSAHCCLLVLYSLVPFSLSLSTVIFLCFRVRPFCPDDEIVIISHNVYAVDIRILLGPINAVCDWGWVLPTETAETQASNSGLCIPVECFEAFTLLLEQLDSIPVQLPRGGGGEEEEGEASWSTMARSVPKHPRWHHVMRHASCRLSLVSRTRAKPSR